MIRAKLHAWLRLGRVSNLPTVWSNTLTAWVLSGAKLDFAVLSGAMALMSTFYVAGMILNDAFDASYDAVHRPQRPIPSGVIGKSLAFGVGMAGLIGAVIGVATLGHALGSDAVESGLWASLLGLAVVTYDAYHKQNPLSPVVMGACRALVLLTTAWMASNKLTDAVIAAAVAHWAYVVGLTYAAKQEDLVRPGSFWPVVLVFLPAALVVVAWQGVGLPGLVLMPSARGVSAAALGLAVVGVTNGLVPLVTKPRQIGVAIGRLISAIALVDALLIATTGWTAGVALAIGFALLTRLFQRVVPGT